MRIFLLDIMTPSFNNKYSKTEAEDQLRKEISNVLENSEFLMSSRVTLLKIIEIFIDDSQIVSGVIKSFRKIIQVLMNDSMNSKLDLKKSFSRDFKVSIFLKITK
jgi:hypothetical protein